MTQKRSSKSLTPNTSPFLLVSIFSTGFSEHLPILPTYQWCFSVNHSLARQIPCIQIITRKKWRQVKREISGLIIKYRKIGSRIGTLFQGNVESVRKGRGESLQG